MLDCLIITLSLSFFWSFQLFPVLGPDHTVALPLAVLTLVLDQGRGPDQDQDLTLTPQVDPDPALVPMAGLIHALLTLDVMDAVMDAHGPGPGLVQGLMGIDGLAHHGLLLPTGEEVGREEKGQDPTGQGHGLAPLLASGAAALVDENHLHGSYHHMT